MKTLSVFAVALHPEGVDRNELTMQYPDTGVDRNPDHPFKVRDDEESPSTRRARVERKS